MYHWVKGEIFDIEAVTKAIQTKETITSQISKKEKTKKGDQSNLDNVTQGRKTVKTLFKTQNDAGSMVTKIEQVSILLSSNFISFLLHRPTKKSKPLTS